MEGFSSHVWWHQNFPATLTSKGTPIVSPWPLWFFHMAMENGWAWPIEIGEENDDYPSRWCPIFQPSHHESPWCDVVDNKLFPCDLPHDIHTKIGPSYSSYKNFPIYKMYNSIETTSYIMLYLINGHNCDIHHFGCFNSSNRTLVFAAFTILPSPGPQCDATRFVDDGGYTAAVKSMVDGRDIEHYRTK